MNEMISGVRADLAVKLFGDDLDVLVSQGRGDRGDPEDDSAAAPTSASSRSPASRCCRSRSKQDELARYGVPAKAVPDVIESIGSKPLGEVIEGQLRFPLVVRLPEEMRAGPEAIGAILVATPAGERLPLSRLATVQVVEGPSTITREWGQRRITVSANVRGRDMGSFVAEAQRRIDDEVSLPPAAIT